MKDATTENIQAIIIGKLRGDSQEAIGKRFGIHREKVKKIMNLRDYRSIIDSAEYIFVTVPLEENNKGRMRLFRIRCG